MDETYFLITVFPPSISNYATNANRKIYSSLKAGFYGVRFGLDPSGSPGSTSYQSLTFDCPTTPGFTDSIGIFSHCTGLMEGHIDSIFISSMLSKVTNVVHGSFYGKGIAFL